MRWGSLDAMMLDVRHSFDRALTAQVPADEADRIRANPFYKALSEAFSGTQEYVAMEKIGELTRQVEETGRWDLIVVDTPPSRSALDFLDAALLRVDIVGDDLAAGDDDRPRAHRLDLFQGSPDDPDVEEIQ